MLRTGLVGRSILASRSPWLHEQEAAAQGIALRYELFDFTDRGLTDAELGPLLRKLAQDGFSGVNITYPFKQVVIPLLDDLADCANAVGAVNTIAMHGGQLIGYNTDKTGFQDSLSEGLPNARLGKVLQLGAGGAGAAVASALLSLGTREVVLADLNPDRAYDLADRIGTDGNTSVVHLHDVVTDDVDGIVNTTPMGMAAYPGAAIDAELIRSHHWVADIVYFPLETELLRIARTKGCETLNGSGMVVGQAAKAFEIFTGARADKMRMTRSFLEG